MWAVTEYRSKNTILNIINNNDPDNKIKCPKLEPLAVWTSMKPLTGSVLSSQSLGLCSLEHDSLVNA